MSVDEWDRRTLCSDGACTGVIGADGLCKVCGRAAQNWGDERKRGLVDPEDGKAADDDSEIDDEADFENDTDDPYDDPEGDDEDDEDGDEEDDGEDDEVDAETADRRGDDWDNRTLCSDGACTGVIGPSGRCTVCGNAP